jgi:hypothetical protein
MSDYYSQFDATEKAFVENTITDCDDEALQKHLLLLSIEPIPNTSVQHRNIIRGITINHILLQRHIDRLNKQNSKMQWLVVVLTIASLIGTGSQVWYADRADKKFEVKSPPIAAQQQMTETKLVNPSQGLPPSSGQPDQKKSVAK